MDGNQTIFWIGGADRRDTGRATPTAKKGEDGRRQAKSVTANATVVRSFILGIQTKIIW